MLHLTVQMFLLTSSVTHIFGNSHTLAASCQALSRPGRPMYHRMCACVYSLQVVVPCGCCGAAVSRGVELPLQQCLASRKSWRAAFGTVVECHATTGKPRRCACATKHGRGYRCNAAVCVACGATFSGVTDATTHGNTCMWALLLRLARLLHRVHELYSLLTDSALTAPDAGNRGSNKGGIKQRKKTKKALAQVQDMSPKTVWSKGTGFGGSGRGGGAVSSASVEKAQTRQVCVLCASVPNLCILCARGGHFKSGSCFCLRLFQNQTFTVIYRCK